MSRLFNLRTPQVHTTSLMEASPFATVDQLLATQGPVAALEHLAEQLRAEGKYHQVFDVRLMQSRYRLGLPLAQPTTIDELAEPARTELENAYIEHCSEVGGLFLSEGRVREAWMYLRPTGDKTTMAQGLAQLEITPENLEQIVEIALHEGVAPELGYGLVLEHFGTCNAITMLDSIAHSLQPAARVALATLLVHHLHGELSQNVRSDIARREGAEPPLEASLQELISARPELFADLNYHVDSSHLAATVKSARILTDPDTLRLAHELAEYGKRLDRTYQYPGDGPFADHYPASALFYAAQLGEQVDEAVAYFGQRAAESTENAVAAEVYIALLARLKRYDEAIDAWQTLLATGASGTGFAPNLMELARSSGQHDRVAEIYRQQGDVVHYLAVRGMAGHSSR